MASNSTIKVVVQECTLRDWFAGMALQGIVTSEKLVDILFKGSAPIAPVLSQMAYESADAMLKQREVKP